MFVRSFYFCTIACVSVLIGGVSSAAPDQPSDDKMEGAVLAPLPKTATKVNDHLFVALGFGNTYLVKTSEGNVIIDTSMAHQAPRHKKILNEAAPGPVKYIILTHGHPDHTGGINLWKEEGTQVIAQSNFPEFLHYQTRLEGMFTERNSAQFGGALGYKGSPASGSPGNRSAEIPTTFLFAETHEFKMGGLTFQLFFTPGETPDHCSVWIPELKAAFVGDNFYLSFPNMYTLRGTQPRWALEYTDSLEKVMSWNPEILLPSHGPPVEGSEEIRKRLRRYHDAILYVHDATVRGMNEGKDVFTLMQEIRLPSDLDVGESYGRVAWSVRGIYEGYMGWFDGDPATMFEIPRSAVDPDLVRLAGGAEVVARRASELVASGEPVKGLHLAGAALKAEPGSRPALEARRAALQALVAVSRNSNEKGWLNYGLKQVNDQLKTDVNEPKKNPR